ncbi:hypothetical protein R1flu_001004 [Riccia fluitans]|uniref:Uncharacterized protein n=1 Tax=Riccia fluitans TaxID=41844 RepID=A0ABD1Y315_9MARC
MPGSTSSSIPTQVLFHSCYDDVGAGSNSGHKPLIVGEWRLSPRDENNVTFEIDSPYANSWYEQWFATQLKDYEEQRAGFLGAGSLIG